MSQLFKLLQKYPYTYFIINNNDNYLFCDNPELINLKDLENRYIITKYPEKFYKYFLDSTKNTV
jgi:hypothetical protein